MLIAQVAIEFQVEFFAVQIEFRGSIQDMSFHARTAFRLERGLGANIDDHDVFDRPKPSGLLRGHHPPGGG